MKDLKKLASENCYGGDCGALPGVDCESCWARSELRRKGETWGSLGLLSRLKELLRICPLGWHEGKLIRTRSTTDEDVVEWLQDLYKLGENDGSGNQA